MLAIVTYPTSLHFPKSAEVGCNFCFMVEDTEVWHLQFIQVKLSREREQSCALLSPILSLICFPSPTDIYMRKLVKKSSPWFTKVVSVNQEAVALRE